MKKLLWGGGVIVALLLILFMLPPSGEKEPEVSADELLTAEAEILRYSIEGGVTDYGFLSYRFTADNNSVWYAQGFIDFNDDGEYTEDEWLVKNSQALVRESRANRFSFTLTDELKDLRLSEVSVQLALTSEKHQTADTLNEATMIQTVAPITSVAIVSQFGLDVPGASEELKRGIGARIAYAEDFEETGIDDTALPDLEGGPMDCFAIATANNLINMASQHGRRDDLPANPTELVEELKNYMQWDNGILNPNFLTGKAAFVEAYELPITTTEIKRPSIEDLADAFANGDAVEVSTVMIRSKSGKDSTGHVLTGVSAYQDGAEAGLAAHDPATPQGTDIFNLSMTGGETPYILVEYPMWDGLMLVDAIYIQNWNEPEAEEDSSSAQLQEPSRTFVDPEREPQIETSFAHVAPGEYSEVYAVVTGLAYGDEVTARLTGGSHNGTPQVVTADQNGTAHFTWRISQYGEYTIAATSDLGVSVSGSVTVN